MIILFVFGLLACCGASFYLGVRMAQADVMDEDEELTDWVAQHVYILQRLVRARRAGRRLAVYWKRKVSDRFLS